MRRRPHSGPPTPTMCRNAAFAHQTLAQGAARLIGSSCYVAHCSRSPVLQRMQPQQEEKGLLCRLNQEDQCHEVATYAKRRLGSEPLANGKARHGATRDVAQVGG